MPTLTKTEAINRRLNSMLKYYLIHWCLNCNITSQIIQIFSIISDWRNNANRILCYDPTVTNIY